MDAQGAAALRRAVEEIEAASAAEGVVAVRARAERWLDPPLVLSGLAGAGALAAALFVPWEFTLAANLLYSVGAMVAGAALGLLRPVARLLVPAAARRGRARAAARALFVERAVHATRGRTGVLIYVELAERQVAVVADLAAAKALDAEEGRRAVARVEGALAGGGGAHALAAALASLTRPLAAALPRAADDENELPDGIVQLGAAPRRSRRAS
jgi:putative membrane protein